MNLDTNFLYKLTNEGKLNTDTGDVASYNIALSYPVNHSHSDPFSHQHSHDHHKTTLEKIFPEHLLGQHIAWDLIAEINSSWEGAPEIDGERDDNHGGLTITLSPGIRAVINDRWTYNLSMGFPVIQELNGVQGHSDFQLYMGVGAAF